MTLAQMEWCLTLWINWDYMTYYPEYVENTMGGIVLSPMRKELPIIFRDGYYNPKIYQEHRALPLLLSV